jgi:hypothetical protein
LVLSSATSPLVGWVEAHSGYVGFHFTQPNLQFVSSNGQCKTQHWPILEPTLFFVSSLPDRSQISITSTPAKIMPSTGLKQQSKIIIDGRVPKK